MSPYYIIIRFPIFLFTIFDNNYIKNNCITEKLYLVADDFADAVLFD